MQSNILVNSNTAHDFEILFHQTLSFVNQYHSLTEQNNELYFISRRNSISSFKLDEWYSITIRVHT